MPLHQGMEFLPRLVEALAHQECPVPWDVLAIDSGSTDGSGEYLAGRADAFPVPLRVDRIPSAEFDHGDTRNLLAARSRGELLVYLTQDAIPSRADWLAALLENFDDPDLAAVTCKNVHRADAWLVTRLLTREDPGYARARRVTTLPPAAEYAAMTADEKRALYSFQNVASALRRSLWERYPFPRTMMGEDALMARGLLEAGYAIALCDRATVDHSHDYGAEKLRWRGLVDGRFNAEWFDRPCVRNPEDVDVLTERLVRADLERLAEVDPEADPAVVEAELRPLRRALVEGLHEGSSAPARYAHSAMRPAGTLRIALVVENEVLESGTPSPRAAHALALAREFLDRGHAVGVVRDDPTVTDGGWDATWARGVRTVRIGGETGWRRWLAVERPDVVHVIVAGAGTPGWIRAAVEARVGTLVTVDEPGRLGAPFSAAAVAYAAADRLLAPTAAVFEALAARRDIDRYRVVPMRRGAALAREQRPPRVRARPADPLRVLALTGSLGSPDEAVEATVSAAAESAFSGRHARMARATSNDLGALAEEAADADVFVVALSNAGERALFGDVARCLGVPVIELGPGDLAGVEDALRAAVDERGPSVPIGLRTPAEETDELVFRYRCVACVARGDELERAPIALAEGTALRPLGVDRTQGGGHRLLLPGESAVLRLGREHAGPAWIVVRQLSLAGERDVVLGGRILVDGAPVALVPRAPSGGEDRAVVQAAQFWIEAGARELRLEATDSNGSIDPALHLRIARVSLSRCAPSSPGLAAADGASELGSIDAYRALAVDPVPRLADADLPRLAVVIPTLDGISDLAEALTSLAGSDYPKDHVQVVVVDNGSTDGTADQVRVHHSRVRLVELPVNEGFARACNLGVAETDAPVVVFVNNDMRFERDFLRELVAPIAVGRAAATTAKRLSWDGERLDGTGVGSTVTGIAVQPGFGKPVTPEHEIQRHTLFACGGAMAIERDTFLAAGGFDEEYFAYYEDLDLGWRMWVMGHSIEYVPSAVCYHHHSATSRRMPPEVVRRMVVRNAIATCIKNYDDANLARMLPVLLGLAVERAYLKSDLDPRSFDPRIAPLTPRGRTEAVPPGVFPVNGIGAADLVALHDILGRWGDWMAARERVQRARRRDDEELFRMFLEPFACVEGDASYVELQNALFDRFGVGPAWTRGT
jgi:GT2 family glycosyltransferase